MKFGKVDNPEKVDFRLPEDHNDTKKVLNASNATLNLVSIGCPKWNRQDLKGFYPRGTKDELTYYSKVFNSIELNATFYNLYGESQILKWKNKTPVDFKFYPKLPQFISHVKRLNDGYENHLNEFLMAIHAFGDQMGMLFLQMDENFEPNDKNIARLKNFITHFPEDLPLAVELRHTAWFNDDAIAEDLYSFFEAYNVTNILVDSAGRRDIMHMRLTTSSAFVRWVGTNHPSDYARLDAWVDRIKLWKDQELRHLCFFVHQNHDLESPILTNYFIKKLDNTIGSSINRPPITTGTQSSLF